LLLLEEEESEVDEELCRLKDLAQGGSQENMRRRMAGVEEALKTVKMSISPVDGGVGRRKEKGGRWSLVWVANWGI
jgi:hypothetical protein